MRPQTGFTLLEMMISLLVLAVGVLGLLRLQTELLHSQMAANDYNTATNLAQAVLEQRHNGALVDCARADYAAFRGNGALSRFRCRREEKDNTITVYMQWTDSQGDENTLRLSAPTVLNVVPPPAK